MPHLYELARDKVELERLMEYGDLDPQTIIDTLEGVEGALEEKAINVAKVTRNQDAVAVAVRDDGKAMHDRAARLEKIRDAIKAGEDVPGARLIQSDRVDIRE